MRLDRYIAESGYGKKKTARELIMNGKISVNGIANKLPYTEIDEKSDIITCNGKQIFYSGHVYYMFNKPAGCVTANSDDKNITVFDYFKNMDTNALFAVGRLDKDTEGLLVITNDGLFNQELMHPDNHISKKYFFCAIGRISKEDITKIENGIVLGNGYKPTKKSKLIITDTGLYNDLCEKNNIVNHILPGNYNPEAVAGYITITEGKKHQVKRMLMYAGCKVIYLKRTMIGALELDANLKSGEYRILKENELNKIKKNND